MKTATLVRQKGNNTILNRTRIVTSILVYSIIISHTDCDATRYFTRFSGRVMKAQKTATKTQLRFCQCADSAVVNDGLRFRNPFNVRFQNVVLCVFECHAVNVRFALTRTSPTELGKRSFHIAPPATWNIRPIPDHFFSPSISKGQFGHGLIPHLFHAATLQPLRALV